MNFGEAFRYIPKNENNNASSYQAELEFERNSPISFEYISNSENTNNSSNIEIGDIFYMSKYQTRGSKKVKVTGTFYDNSYVIKEIKAGGKKTRSKSTRRRRRTQRK